jgi:hypothetical protein
LVNLANTWPAARSKPSNVNIVTAVLACRMPGIFANASIAITAFAFNANYLADTNSSSVPEVVKINRSVGAPPRSTTNHLLAISHADLKCADASPPLLSLRQKAHLLNFDKTGVLTPDVTHNLPAPRSGKNNSDALDINSINADIGNNGNSNSNLCNDISFVDISYTFNADAVANSSSNNNSFDKPTGIIDIPHTLDTNATDSNSNSKHTDTLDSGNTDTSPIRAIPNTTACDDEHEHARVFPLNARSQAPPSATHQPERSEEPSQHLPWTQAPSLPIHKSCKTTSDPPLPILLAPLISTTIPTSTTTEAAEST